jgi:rhodanese-related sulfurtransferase
MRIPLLLIVGCLSPGLPGDALAADKADVKAKWHTPYDLYLDPAEAFAMKTGDPDRVTFIDVRTQPEVQFVGFSEVADANIPYRTLDTGDWRIKYGGEYATQRQSRNPDFVAAVDKLLASRSLDRDAPIILMCTSGARSPKAARTLHEAGFGKVYTQYQGFEGIKAKQGPNTGKRMVNGWRNAGLPWGYALPKSKMYFNFAPEPEQQ